MLYVVKSGNLLVVDVDCAECRGRQPLGLVSPGCQNRKRTHGVSQKQETDDFASQLESAAEKGSMCIASVVG
jgi:hypothetical protein